MAANEIQVLVLGAEGTGKTLLLKRIQSEFENRADSAQDYESTPSTVSTIGTNISSILINKRKVNLRELGGAMAPIWKNYFGDATSTIFLVDASNNFQISASTILLLDVLGAEKLAKQPFLLLLNKTNLSSTLTLKELRFILRLNELKKHITQKLKIVECSLKTGSGMQEIKDWLTSL